MITKGGAMNWDRLRIFYWVAKLGSISKAAQKLNTSQPAVSHQILMLEDSLGLELFVRLPQGVRLTPKGEILNRVIQDTYQNIDAVLARVKEEEKEIEGPLRICTSHGFASIYLTQHIVKFLKLYPKVRLSLYGTDLTIDPTDGDIDIVIRPKMKERQDIIQHHMMTMSLKMYASAEYLVEYGTPKTPQDLDNHKLIAYGNLDKHPYADLNWHLKVGMAEGKIRDPYLVTNATFGRTRYAEEGLGIILIPDKHPAIVEAGLVCVMPEVATPKVDLYCIYPKRLENLKKISYFTDFITQVYEGNPIEKSAVNQ